MNGLRSLLASPVFLIIGIVVLAGSALGAIFPAADYIKNTSVSTTNNFYLVGALMLGLAVLAVFEAVLAVRLIWGRGAITGDNQKKHKSDLQDDLADIKTMRVTGMKKALVFGVFLAVNIIVFDLLSGGILVTGTRRHHVLTQLRSSDGTDHKAAVEDTIQLVGDREIAVALQKIMDNPGEGRHWAAYAAGKRLDGGSRDSLSRLLSTGTPIERAASAVALARLKDPRLIRLVIDAYPDFGEY